MPDNDPAPTPEQQSAVLEQAAEAPADDNSILNDPRRLYPPAKRTTKLKANPEDYVVIPSSKDLGPKMRSLQTDKQKRFVLALVKYGAETYAEAARMAGYKASASRMVAAQLMSRQDILEAIKEETDRRLYAGLALSGKTLLRIIEDDATKPAEKLKALEMLDKWCGSPSKQAERKAEHVDPERTEKEMIKKLTVLSKDLGVDPKKFLGENHPIDVDEDSILEDE